MLGCTQMGLIGPRVYRALAPPVASWSQQKGRIGPGTGGTAMLLESMQSIDSKDAPSLTPDDRPIDLVHLSRTTFGDRALEREVLQLFDRQSSMLITRMRTAPPAAVAALAHTLNGSARGIGAWRVARAAE